MTVARVWAEHDLKPWRAETFRFSADPGLHAKVADLCGLYLDPPAGAIVVCIDEKPQIQALDRTAPTLPVRPGLAERRTHDYVRHGVTDLFAALETATGRVLGRCFPRHRHDEFLVFLRQVARTWPRRELHVVCDNASAHKHAAVTTWLARHPRITLHFTPTSASWMNQVETFLGLLTRQALRRGSFKDVPDLAAAIGRYVQAWKPTATRSPGSPTPTRSWSRPPPGRSPRGRREHVCGRSRWRWSGPVRGAGASSLVGSAGWRRQRRQRGCCLARLRS
jgi:transposase